MENNFFTGYKFVAAANLYKNYGGLAIYTKFKPRNRSANISVKDCGKNFIHYDTPDREVVLVRNSFSDDAFRPHGFDLCLDLNTFKDDVCKNIGLDYVMTNYIHDSSNVGRGHVAEESKQVQILSDSGGLQLVRGVSSLIHPKDLVEFYNKNVDAGMILDLPLFTVTDDVTTKRAAVLQKRNNEVMIKHSRPGLELLNIFHGGSITSRQSYRDIVETDKINRVAIGGLGYQKPLTGVNTIYEIVLGGSFRYKQYHVLGIFDMGYLPLMVKIANSGENPPHITSDSTSHVQASLNNVWHSHLSDQQIMSRIALGTQSGSVGNKAITINCSCPICSSLKYRDLFAFGHNRFNGFMALHNAIEMVKYTSSLQEACLSMSPHEYNRYVMTQLRRAKNRDDVKMALDFIDVVTEHGLKKAQLKYKHHIGKWNAASEAGTALFSTGEEQPDATREQVLSTLSALEKQLEK